MTLRHQTVQRDRSRFAESKDHLSTHAGFTVLLESDESMPDGKRLSRHAWTGDCSLLISETLVSGGFATVKSDDHSFQAMLAGAQLKAKSQPAGLWAECVSDEEPQIALDDAPVSDADRAYLVGLQEDLELLEISLLLIGPALQDGVVQDSERQLLGTVLVGVGVTDVAVQITTSKVVIYSDFRAASFGPS